MLPVLLDPDGLHEGRDCVRVPDFAELEAYLKTARGTEVEGEALWLLGVYRYREAWTSDKATSEDRRVELEKAIGHLEELDKPHFDEFLLGKPPRGERLLLEDTRDLRTSGIGGDEHRDLRVGGCGDLGGGAG